MATSLLLLCQNATHPRKNVKNKIGHETAKNVSFFINLYDGFEALDLNINILISKNTRECRNIPKNARKNQISFPGMCGIYIFSYCLNKIEIDTAIYFYIKSYIFIWKNTTRNCPDKNESIN